MLLNKTVIVIERECGKTLFIEVCDDIITTCVDENGKTIELIEEEKKYVFIKHKHGACDARYSWGKQ